MLWIPALSLVIKRIEGFSIGEYVVSLTKKCFYDCDFVNRFVDRRILRTVCGRSFLSQRTYEIGEQLQNKTRTVLLSKEYFPRQSGSL